MRTYTHTHSTLEAYFAGNKVIDVEQKMTQDDDGKPVVDPKGRIDVSVVARVKTPFNEKGKMTVLKLTVNAGGVPKGLAEGDTIKTLDEFSTWTYVSRGNAALSYAADAITADVQKSAA